MKLESIYIHNFRCFGPNGSRIEFEPGLTAFVGGNGSGKTAVFQAISRLFGITSSQRTVWRQDFHLAVDQEQLTSGASLAIEVVLGFPELDGVDEDARRDAVPEFFSQMATLLKGRLWQAAKWSTEFRERATEIADDIQTRFEREPPAEFVIERLTKSWQQVHEADTDTTPVLRLVESRFEELVRRAEFAFSPDEAGQERALADLSDGQRSLFHIALTAATLEVERDAFAFPLEKSAFDREKLRRVHLTLLAIEEPENSLSPFFLSRIVLQSREIGALVSAQVVVSSH